MIVYSYSGVKRWWRSRSLWFARALMLAGAIVETVNASSGLLTPYFGKWGGLVIVGIGVVNEILRWATTKPLGQVPKIERIDRL